MFNMMMDMTMMMLRMIMLVECKWYGDNDDKDDGTELMLILPLEACLEYLLMVLIKMVIVSVVDGLLEVMVTVGGSCS